MTHKLSKLLEWCHSKRITVDPRLSIVENRDGDITVYNTSEKFIANLTTVVTIPKRAILSIRTCALSRKLTPLLESKKITIPPYGHNAKLVLALALYNELLLKSESEWADYLQSLPEQTVPIALLWGYDYEDGSAADTDGLEAISYISDTEAEFRFKNEETGEYLLTEISTFYAETVVPLLSQHEINLRGFHHAYSLVSSRAFLVDAYHGLSMVPIADMFNHVQENHVHLESDYDVCTSCGSVTECPHDSGQTSLVSNDYDSDEEDNTCEMVTNCVIAPGSEIFNTYGEGLSNGELLVQYGFILEDGNDNDVIIFDYKELPEGLGRVTEACIAQWGYDGRWEQSEMVFNARKEGETKRGLILRIDAGGRMSHDLWVCSTLWNKREVVEEEIENVVTEMKGMVEKQLKRESEWNMERDNAEGVNWGNEEEHREVKGMCKRRLARLESGQCCSQEETPRPKTRQALIQFIEYRRILNRVLGFSHG